MKKLSNLWQKRNIALYLEAPKRYSLLLFLRWYLQGERLMENIRRLRQPELVYLWLRWETLVVLPLADFRRVVLVEAELEMVEAQGPEQVLER
jgi:hypothetical protein